MQEDNKLKILTAGLVLGALAISYFIITQKVNNNQTNHIVQKPTASALPTPTPLPTLEPSSTPAPIPGNTKGGTNSLPKTGFPLPLVGVFATSFLVTGYFLRKFPD